ncbi:MAG: hypothetical protein JO055_18200 [Alphaproteobacteria bacterium]|nr:hypothetical protein [Alphaproteobacteria bacterium]
MASRSVLLACLLGALALPAAAQQSLPQTTKVGDQVKRTFGTVEELRPGDRACTIILRDTRSVQFSEFTTDEICGMHIIGKRVQLVYKLDEIQAESCKGNPRCMKKETVVVVVDVRVMK